MKKILILAAGNNGTIGLCSINLYKAFRLNSDIIVKLAVVHQFENGIAGFEEAVFCENTNQRIGMVKQLSWLKKIKKDFAPDITVSTLFSVNTLNVLSGGKDIKIGIFHSPHQQAKAKGLLHYSGILFAYNFIYPKLDRLFCVSVEVADSLNSFPLLNKKKVQVVYNVHFLDEIIAKSEIPLPLEYQEIFCHPVILYCGRLDANKAPDRAIKAFAKTKKPSDAQLVFIGTDMENMTIGLKDLARSLEIENQVHFVGQQGNPYPFMKGACALISTSYSEGLPGVMIEALAVGTPVLTTNSSKGIWEIFSCTKDYNKELQINYENECGIITPNHPLGKKYNNEHDIDCLSEGIEAMFNIPRVQFFKFADSVNSVSVVSKYLL